MAITILGAHPLTVDDEGKLKNRIATVFVGADVLVTRERMHVLQRPIYSEFRDQQRQAQGLPPLTDEERDRELDTAVDLVMDGGYVKIRPDPDNMPLAFAADALLQELIPKRLIKFMFARNGKVQQSIRERGEYWRISPVPIAIAKITETIVASRIALGGRAIYYHSAATGTRFLTFQEFTGLGALGDAELRSHLAEVHRCVAARNHLKFPEVAFFGVGEPSNARELAARLGECVGAADLRASYAQAVSFFRHAVPATLWEDNPRDPHWRDALFGCLMGEPPDVEAVDLLKGVTAEFFRSVRWLPGGRIEHAELMFDSIFGSASGNTPDEASAALCDERVRGFIFNYLREFGRLEYVNIGHLSPDLRRHPREGGHRAYIAEVKHQGQSEPVVRILRIQTWGIREHLDDGMPLLGAILEAEEYTEYILDRRLGCWQLGMPLPSRIDTHRISEIYGGPKPQHRDRRYWTTYFERDFIPGVATDKIARARFQDRDFALAFARLLGRAAAPNLVVGRKGHAGRIKFDGGDEVLILDAAGMPERIVVADHAGTFVDYESELSEFVEEYAGPVLTRIGHLEDPAAFAEAYVAAFAAELRNMQRMYRHARRAFDTLFLNSKQGPKTFSDRWAKALARLDRSDAGALADQIRARLHPDLRSPASAPNP